MPNDKPYEPLVSYRLCTSCGQEAYGGDELTCNCPPGPPMVIESVTVAGEAQLSKEQYDAIESYIYLDEGFDGEKDYVELHVGNLPIPCPNCGRMRLNLLPMKKIVKCEKCEKEWSN